MLTVELENVNQGTEDQQNKNIEPENDIVTDSHFDPENISHQDTSSSTLFLKRTIPKFKRAQVA